MKHLRLFKTNADYESTILDLPNVSFVEESDLIIFNPTATTDYEYVDLGLPSGTLWATCNVGATKPEEYGLYFAWGETEGYSDAESRKKFSWSDYKFSINGTKANLSKYNSTDGLTTLELTDDAAHVIMGGNWRMPTETEYNELISNTTRAWTTENGVKGMKFTSNKSGYTDKYIFVPAAGYCSNGYVLDTGSYGYLWSSSRLSYRTSNSVVLNLGSKDASTYDFYRNNGYPVRGVINPND